MLSTANILPSSRFISLLPWVLAGYALIGRGFAELYLCELLLLVLVMRLIYRPSTYPSVTLWPSVTILVLLCWSFFRTIPFLTQYKVLAIRDFMLVGYSLLAIGVAGVIISRPQNLLFLLYQYGRFVPVYLLLLPLLWTVMHYFESGIPRIPGTGKPILLIKGGDALVHLAGAACFIAAGLQRRSLAWQLLIGVSFLSIGLAVRAGFLSFLVALGMFFLMRPANRMVWRSTGAVLLIVFLTAVTQVRLQIPGLEREISFDQLQSNVTSITGSANTDTLDGSKEWRKLWWKKIASYTLYGPYFWGGKGFGVNLGDQDGFSIDELGSLRSPHNGHLNMLARGGVPGLILWIAVLVSWYVSMLLTYIKALGAGDVFWSRLILFLMSYWCAFVVNAAFDVFLEGPVGAMWFWTIHGVGLAVFYLYRTSPELCRFPVELTDGKRWHQSPTPVAVA